jgi:hypothetical protein
VLQEKAEAARRIADRAIGVKLGWPTVDEFLVEMQTRVAERLAAGPQTNADAVDAEVFRNTFIRRCCDCSCDVYLWCFLAGATALLTFICVAP